ncbi:MAG TPA: hypothetical protein VFB59_02380 [Candidatus Saccharimonadales bacterium]|nr:hypothetical protein [Candidatus Saccharimonadales bacterium]
MSILRPSIVKVKSIYNYLIEPATELPPTIDMAVVFGRKSRHLAHAAIATARRAERLFVTGETGKDSGDNPRFGISESAYLLSAISFAGVGLSRVSVDPYHPKNGVDNARNTMRMVREIEGVTAIGTLVGVMHSTQTRRLGLTLATEAERGGIIVDTLSLCASPYPFDPYNRFDQNEAAFEIVRMDELAREGVFARPEGLDKHLPYATDLLKYHQERFKAENPPILNPSTADNTLRTVHPDELQAMYLQNK